MYYEDRSEYSSEMEEAGFDDIQEEEFISGAIGEKEDERERQTLKEERRRKRMKKGLGSDSSEEDDDCY